MKIFYFCPKIDDQKLLIFEFAVVAFSALSDGELTKKFHCENSDLNTRND